MSDTVHIKYYIETDKLGSRCEEVVEFERAEWEAMSPTQQEAEMKEHAFNWMEWGFSEVATEQEDNGQP
jgi:K+/H+ antiporter YhaU regulatory subunit KhtT